jgi:hypothetical protein
LQLGLVAAGLGLVARPALDMWMVSPSAQGNLQRAIGQFGEALAHGMQAGGTKLVAFATRRSKR